MTQLVNPGVCGCPGRAWPGQVCSNTALEDSDLVYPQPHFSHCWGQFISWRRWGGAGNRGSPGFTSLHYLEFHSRFRLSTLPLAKSLLLLGDSRLNLFSQSLGDSPPFPQAYYAAYRMSGVSKPPASEEVWSSPMLTVPLRTDFHSLPSPTGRHVRDAQGKTVTPPSSSQVGIPKPQWSAVCLVRGKQMS